MIFHYRYEFYEYQVMSFDLCNASDIFQYLVNDIFHDYLDDFLIIYLNNLLIYFNILKEYKKYVHLILQRLQVANLYLKLSKYEFHIQIIFFLDYIIISKGIRMNFVKIDFILY